MMREVFVVKVLLLSVVLGACLPVVSMAEVEVTDDAGVYVKRGLDTFLIPYKKGVRVSRRRLKRKKRSLSKRKRQTNEIHFSSLVESTSERIVREKHKRYTCPLGGTLEHTFGSSLEREPGVLIYERDANSLLNDCNGISGNLETKIDASLFRLTGEHGNMYSFESIATVSGSGKMMCTHSELQTPGQIHTSLTLNHEFSSGVTTRTVTGTFEVGCEVAGELIKIASCHWDATSLRDSEALKAGCSVFEVQ